MTERMIDYDEVDLEWVIASQELLRLLEKVNQILVKYPVLRPMVLDSIKPGAGIAAMANEATERVEGEQ